MPDDDLENVVVVDDADEEAGFNSIAEESPALDAEDDQQEEVETGDQEADVANAEVDAGEQQAETQVELTPEQKAEQTQQELAAMLNKLPENQQATDQQIQKIHGKLGDLNRQLQTLQQRNGGSTGRLKINPEKFKRLSENFDPEIAKDLAEDLAEAIELEGGGADPVDFDERIASATNQISQNLKAEFSTQLLDITHKGWREDIQSQEFADWKKTLTPEQLNVVDNSENSVEAAEMLTTFKGWRASKKETIQRKNERLASAMTPTGKGSVVKGAVTEEDGFNSYSKGR